MMKKIMMIIIGMMYLCTACSGTNSNIQDNPTIALTTTPIPSSTPELLSEKAELDKVDCGFNQVASSAVYYKEQLYYLSATTINEQGEEGCYLNSESDKDILWMPYNTFGRGIYVSGDELYLLTHDKEKYSLSKYFDGKVEKIIDIATYTGVLEKENLLGTCIRMTSSYVYVLSKTEVNNEYPSEFAVYGLELVRFSLADGKMQQVKRVENNEILTRYICANYNVNDNYVSYLLATHLFDSSMIANRLDTDMIEVLDSEDFSLVNSVQSVSRQYVMDKSGNLYYSFTQSKEEETDTNINEYKLCVKKVDEEAKVICKLGEGHALGEYNTYFDGVNFIVDNCQLSDGNIIKRQISVIDLKGKIVRESCLSEKLPELDDATLELATALYCHDSKLLLELQDIEKNEKVILNTTSDELSQLYICNSDINFVLAELPVSKVFKDDFYLESWKCFSGINGDGTFRYGHYKRVEAEYLDLEGIFRVNIANHGIIIDSGETLIGESKVAFIITDRDNIFACDKIRVQRITSFTIEDGSEHTINEEDWYKCCYFYSDVYKFGNVSFIRDSKCVTK